MVESSSTFSSQSMMANIIIRTGGIPITKEEENCSFELKVELTIGKYKVESKYVKYDFQNLETKFNVKFEKQTEFFLHK